MNKNDKEKQNITPEIASKEIQPLLTSTTKPYTTSFKPFQSTTTVTRPPLTSKDIKTTTSIKPAINKEANQNEEKKDELNDLTKQYVTTTVTKTINI